MVPESVTRRDGFPMSILLSCATADAAIGSFLIPQILFYINISGNISDFVCHMC